MFSGSLVALITPMHPDGAVDFDCLRSLVDFHVEEATNGLVIAGTTGESATLTTDEHVEVVRVAAEQAAGRLPVIAGTGSNSTRQTVELSRAVGELPVDGYLVVTPYYNKPTQEGLVQHFSAVADAVSLPVILYNVPGRTAVDLTPATTARLATHPNILGIKEATGEVSRVAQLRDGCGEDFRLYSGDDPTSSDFMLAGGHGVISVTANVAPAAMAQMCARALAGQGEQAAKLDQRLAKLHRNLFVESNPIPVKWALERLGLAPGGIRLPLTTLSRDGQDAVEDALVAAGLI